jgi:putative membrane protein
MIITKKIRIKRVIIGTWKSALLVVLVCTASYFFSKFVFQDVNDLPAVIPSILGTALAFFIGFNNNQAYDRWWEARKIWGALVNDSRSWARQINAHLSVPDGQPKENLIEKKKTAIFRHIAFLYALKGNLRNENVDSLGKYISQQELETIKRQSNIHNAILNIQSLELEVLYRDNWIDGFRFIELNKMLIRFSDEMGKSERIKNTVFPPTYNFYTRVFIWVMMISTTFVVADVVGAWSIFYGALIGYIFIVIHHIGQVLLNPFENVPSGISLDQITRTIEINLLETLGESEIPEPIKIVNDEYIM